MGINHNLQSSNKILIMSYTRIWVHAVFSTKNWNPTLHESIRQKVFTHIKENAKKKEIIMLEVNGYVDHAHCLFAMHKELSISKTMQLIKGESSYWINKNNLCQWKFQWQDDYWAVSVSESGVSSVQNYIRLQEQHHSNKNFNEEIDELFEKYGGTWQEGTLG